MSRRPVTDRPFTGTGQYRFRGLLPSPPIPPPQTGLRPAVAAAGNTVGRTRTRSASSSPPRRSDRAGATALALAAGSSRRDTDRARSARASPARAARSGMTSSPPGQARPGLPACSGGSGSTGVRQLVLRLLQFAQQSVLLVDSSRRFQCDQLAVTRLLEPQPEPGITVLVHPVR